MIHSMIQYTVWYTVWYSTRYDTQYDTVCSMIPNARRPHSCLSVFLSNHPFFLSPFSRYLTIHFYCHAYDWYTQCTFMRVCEHYLNSKMYKGISLLSVSLPVQPSLLFMTQCQNEVRILSGRTQKLKVAKRCCKQLNEHNLMYIQRWKKREI